MALQGGHRFSVTMNDAFPSGLYATGVDRAEDYDEKTGRRTPAKDKISGEYVWNVSCIDGDPAARRRDVRVKVIGPNCPDLPAELIPGFRPVEFSGLVVTPYIEETGGGRTRMAYSFRATGVHGAGSSSRTASAPPSSLPVGSRHGSDTKPS